jgi:GNAT superfamily N-acetyltransferase
MAQVQIEQYRQEYLPGMTDLFNAETAHEPHIAPLTPERFITLIEQKSYFDPAGLLVAVEAGQVVGWIHACVAPGSEYHHEQGRPPPRIRMVIFPRARLAVGQTLVAEATAWLRAVDYPYIEALHARDGYPFYRGLWMGGEPMGLSSLPHVQMVLEVNDYKNAQEAVFMTTAMPTLPPPCAPIRMPDLKTALAAMVHPGMHDSWIGFAPMRTVAYLDGEEAGSISWVIQPHLDRLGAPCMNIWGLGVRGLFRRQGIAALLISDVMRQSYQLGARFASVGTQLWNAPAHATYAKLGYRPHVILVGRLLEPAADTTAS